MHAKIKPVFYFLSLTLLMWFNGRAQIINTIAGNGITGFSGDGGPAISASFNQSPHCVIDAGGNIYITDYNNNRIRKVDAAGTITTYAGTGVGGYSGDGGLATAAKLNHPNLISMDGAGNIYFGDQLNHVIRKITPANIITTIAGNGTAGSAGDGLPATNAQLNNPLSAAVDAAGNIFIADYGNHRIRKVSAAGIMSTYAGTGIAGFSGDGGPASAAKIWQPTSVCFDLAGNLYITDQLNNRIRKVTPAGIISTVAGSSTVVGYTGDGGPATNAKMYYPAEVTVDPAGCLYIADSYNDVIRKINASGIITTIAGTGVAGYSGDGGPAVLAKLNECTGVALNNAGDLYIGDFFNSRVRRIIFGNLPPTFDSGNTIHLSVCENSSSVSISSKLSVTDSNSGQIETWSLLNPPVHGIVVGLSTTLSSTGGSISPFGVTYTPTAGYSGADSCRITVFDGFATDTIMLSINVMSLPNAGIVSGPVSFCVGTAGSFTSTVGGGLWTSSIPSIATVNTSSGVSGGVSVGSAIISYSVSNSCGTSVDTQLVTVISMPAAGTISGPVFLCSGSSGTFTSGVGGGTWTSSIPSVATINISSGMSGGVSAGSSIISYSVSNLCGTSVDTQLVTVVSMPSAGTVSGPVFLCPGSSGTFTSGVGGGTWTSSTTSVATINSASGLAGGITAGSSVISYTVNNICGSATDTQMLSVSNIPYAGTITGPTSVCVGSSISFTGIVSGGTWTSSNPGVATVATGMAGGVNGGTVIISYTLTNSCGTSTDTQMITVLPLPASGAISGPQRVCLGLQISLTDASLGGTWSSTNIPVATVGVTSGVVSGVSAGTSVISYSVTNSCGTVADTQSVTVLTLPDAGTIVSSSPVICSGASMSVSNTVGGGWWSSSSPLVATVGATGIVYPVSAGNATITYLVTDDNGCINWATMELTILAASPMVVAADIIPIKCNGESNGGINLSVNGGSGIYQYLWSDGNTTSSISGLASGSYSVVVVDNNSGCTDTATYIIGMPGALMPELNIDPDRCHSGSGSAAIVNIAGGTPPFSYLWGNGLTSSSINDVPSGAYNVTITDAHSCNIQLTATVSEDSCDILTVHNVITPNGDGYNDVWIIDGLDSYPDNDVKVFDKWGDEVFGSAGYKNNWNGGKVSDGTYFYLVKVTGKVLKGSLLIKR